MIDEKGIFAWLRTLPDPSDRSIWAKPTTDRKRKALQAPSPPATESDMETTPTGKRRKLDVNRTPRPPRNNAPSISAASSTSESCASSLYSGSASSVKRQIMGLSLDEAGFDRRLLIIDKPPVPEATNIFSSLADVGDGEGILPLDRRDEVLHSPEVQEAGPRRWKHSFKDSAEFEGLSGRIPTQPEIATVFKRATECHTLGHEEAGWNEEVHSYLLAAVFRGPFDSEKGLFDFTKWQVLYCMIELHIRLTVMDSTTARPHKMLLPKSIGIKMVDYCIYADLSREDPELEDKLRSLSRHTMTLSVNHIVDIPRLQLRPIVLSIETKEPNQSLNAAEVQMGVWHSTQWAFLRYAMLSLLRSTSEVSTETDKYEKQADDALSHLAFIPGIIVHGHRWLFVLSTCGEGKKMQLWTEYEFGSTLSVRGIYQVVAGLRLLTSWAETVYLPWFQQNVLTHVKT